jgi:hypothetical protein
MRRRRRLPLHKPDIHGILFKFALYVLMSAQSGGCTHTHKVEDAEQVVGSVIDDIFCHGLLFWYMNI